MYTIQLLYTLWLFRFLFDYGTFQYVYVYTRVHGFHEVFFLSHRGHPFDMHMCVCVYNMYTV